MLPASVIALRHYSVQTFAADLLADVLRNMRRYFQAHVQEALRILGDL